MPQVRVYDNEPFEKALRRFKKAVDKSNILNELRDKEFHEKPSLKRKKARASAKKRLAKQIREDSLPNQHRKY